MRKPDKAPLRNVLLSEKATIHSEKTKGKYVLTVGHCWWKGMKFKEFQKHMYAILEKIMVMHISFLMVMMR